MKHSPIALGFAAFASLTVLAACNANRPADTTLDNALLKKRCASPYALDLNGINKNRQEKLSEKSDMARVVVTESDEEFGLQLSAYDLTNQASVELMDVRMLNKDCSSLNATVTFAGVEYSGKITDINTDKIVLAVERRISVDGQEADTNTIAETVTIEVAGIDDKVKMNEISKEDGLNKIVLKVQGEVVETGVKTYGKIVTSESVSAVRDDLEHEVSVRALLVNGGLDLSLLSDQIRDSVVEKVQVLRSAKATAEAAAKPTADESDYSDLEGQTLILNLRQIRMITGDQI